MGTAPTRILHASGAVLLAAGILLHGLFLASLLHGQVDFLFEDCTYRLGRGADFFALYQAAENVSHGTSVYERDPQPRVVPYFYPYRYLPFPAYTFGQGLRRMPPHAALVLWVSLLEALLISNLVLTWRSFRGHAVRSLATASWLLFTPYYPEIYLGQFSFLMASLLFWALRAWRARKDATGNGLWIASILVKPNAAVLAPVLLRMGRWRVVLAAAGVAAALTLPYFGAVPGSWDAFTRNLTSLSAANISGNQGCVAFLAAAFLRLRGHWASALDPLFGDPQGLTDELRAPVAAWTSLVLIVSVLVTARARREARLELTALWVLTYFLVYKHVWEHHYVLLLPVLVMLMEARVTAAEGPPARAVPLVVLGTGYLLVALPTPFAWLSRIAPEPGRPMWSLDPELWWSTRESLAYHAAKPCAVLLLYAALAVAILRGAAMSDRGSGGQAASRPSRL